MRKLICVLMIFALLAGSAHALTGEWDAIARIEGNEDAYFVRRDGLWGMIDREGKVLVKPMFDAEPEFTNGFAVVTVPDPNPREGFSGEEEYGSYYGIITHEGEFLLKPEHEHLNRSADGMMIRYKLGDTYHFLNLETGKKLPGSYDRAEDFFGDYAVVGMKGAQVDKNLSAPEVMHWGTIDRNGKTGIQMGYDAVELYADGTAVVKLKGKFGYMHADGREITRCRYDTVWGFADGIGIVGKITKSDSNDSSDPNEYALGAVDMEGNELLPCIYSEIDILPDGRLQAKGSVESRIFEVQDGKAVEVAD